MVSGGNHRDIPVGVPDAGLGPVELSEMGSERVALGVPRAALGSCGDGVWGALDLLIGSKKGVDEEAEMPPSRTQGDESPP